jgi:hypothetical protein
MCDDHEKHVRLGCLALPARTRRLSDELLETVGRRGAGKCPQERRNQKSTIIFSRWW